MNKKFVLLFCLVFAFSCGTNQPAANNQNKSESVATPTATPTPTPTASPKTEKGNGHEHKAPRGGTLVGLGEEFAHLEIILDESTGKITAYVLDGEAEKSIQITQEKIELEIEKPRKVSLELMAVENALTGEKIGATSEFSTQTDELKGFGDFDAIIKSIKVKGKEFTEEKFNFPKGNEHK